MERGDYRDTLAVGSLSKAFSCFGAFVACSERMKLLLKIRSGPIVFGGPVPPPYLDAVCVVVDIFDSPSYHVLRARLAENMEQFLTGVRGLGVTVLGGVGAIASIVVGDELTTLRVGRDQRVRPGVGLGESVVRWVWTRITPGPRQRSRGGAGTTGSRGGRLPPGRPAPGTGAWPRG